MTASRVVKTLTALNAAATEGPWWNDGSTIFMGRGDNTWGTDHPGWMTWLEYENKECDERRQEFNGAFIAYARADLPACLDEIERLTVLLDRLPPGGPLLPEQPCGGPPSFSAAAEDKNKA